MKETEIRDSSKILIIAGKNDDEISEKDIKKFGKLKNIKVNMHDLGHITLSKIPSFILKEILEFFSK